MCTCTRRILCFAVAACVVMALSAGMASAAGNQIGICHKGNDIEVDVHAVPAHLQNHADTIGTCGGTVCGACNLIFDPVNCPNGRVYANECFATCDGQSDCERRCVCTDIFNLVVCGGVTYANICQAACAGATDCGRACPCTDEYDPVTCTSDGKTYINQCQATCADATGCGRTCACSNIFNPVTCGGVTYSNICQAACANASSCTVNCACPNIFDPVTCSSDGKTYASQCVATCSGASSCNGEEGGGD